MISFRTITSPGYQGCNSYCLFFLSSQLLYCGSQYCHSRPLPLKGLWCSICAEWTAFLEVLIGVPCFHSGAGRLANHCHLKQRYVYHYEPASVTTPMNSCNADTCFYIRSIVAVSLGRSTAHPAVTVESTASYQGAGIMISTVCGCAQSWNYPTHSWNPYNAKQS